jgi:hypothetical protein
VRTSVERTMRRWIAGPTWSPDGRVVAFLLRYRGGKFLRYGRIGAVWRGLAAQVDGRSGRAVFEFSGPLMARAESTRGHDAQNPRIVTVSIGIREATSEQHPEWLPAFSRAGSLIRPVVVVLRRPASSAGWECAEAVGLRLWPSRT